MPQGRTIRGDFVPLANPPRCPEVETEEHVRVDHVGAWDDSRQLREQAGRHAEGRAAPAREQVHVHAFVADARRKLCSRREPGRLVGAQGADRDLVLSACYRCGHLDAGLRRASRLFVEVIGDMHDPHGVLQLRFLQGNAADSAANRPPLTSSTSTLRPRISPRTGTAKVPAATMRLTEVMDSIEAAAHA